MIVLEVVKMTRKGRENSENISFFNGNLCRTFGI